MSYVELRLRLYSCHGKIQTNDNFYKGKLEPANGVNYTQESCCTQMISRCRVGRFWAVKRAAWYCVRRGGNEQIPGFVACNKNSTELNPPPSPHPNSPGNFSGLKQVFRRKSRDCGRFTPNSLVHSVVFQGLLLYHTLSSKSNLKEEHITPVVALHQEPLRRGQDKQRSGLFFCFFWTKELICLLMRFKE